MDLRKAFGGADNLLIIIVGGVALLYVATGANAWAEEKWGRGAGAASGAAGLLKSGKLVGKKEGWEEGFNTYNPKLHVADVIGYQGPGSGIAGGIAQGVTAGVATAVVSQGVDYAMSRLPQWPSDEQIPPPPSAPEPQQPSLPEGWRIDGQGRFRDETGRVASNDRRRDALRREGR
jgi:hypothetical protein